MMPEKKRKYLFLDAEELVAPGISGIFWRDIRRNRRIKHLCIETETGREMTCGSAEGWSAGWRPISRT